MSIRKLEELSQEIANSILDGMISGHFVSCQLKCSDGIKLTGYSESVFDHVGLYGFRIRKNGLTAVSYIGKTEDAKRMRQHLTSKNIKDNTEIAKSVKHKHKEIKEAILQGFGVDLCLYENVDFSKASLACIEIATSLLARSDCRAKFPEFEHWNKRIG